MLGPFLLFGIYKAVKSTRARRRQTSFKQRPRLAPGETPETAIPLKENGEIARHLAAFRCLCGISYSNEDGPPQAESAVFDGRRLTVIRLKCETCNRFQDVTSLLPTFPAVTRVTASCGGSTTIAILTEIAFRKGEGFL